MLPSRVKSISSPSKLSIISLSSFDTNSSLVNDHQFLVYDHNINNNKSYLTDQHPLNTRSLHQTLDQAVECFEKILNRCTTLSNTSFRQDNDRQEDENLLQSKQREYEDFPRSITSKENIRSKQQEMKINCRQWCEEQNQRKAKSALRIHETDKRLNSRHRPTLGSIFFCRKALVQKLDGTTYICIRKRSN